MNSPQTRWLGQSTLTPLKYSPDILEPIPRMPSHVFEGEDQWFLYELSWLTPSGRPDFRNATLTIPATSPAMVESKSLKLYLNSLNQEIFENATEFEKRVTKDISEIVGAVPQWKWGTPIRLALMDDGSDGSMSTLHETDLISLDDQTLLTTDIASDNAVDQARHFLQGVAQSSPQLWMTRLFRSLCPVTGQPDWAKICIHMEGQGPSPQALLTYLLSYRRHSGFHEQCAERICEDLWQQCSISYLEVKAYFMPRGGISINPRRSLRRI
ncbi:MAG: NADPH-dependent 7-cyano-7-deazaguanine reductase QueF [Pseudomonadota bacterium]